MMVNNPLLGATYLAQFDALRTLGRWSDEVAILKFQQRLTGSKIQRWYAASTLGRKHQTWSSFSDAFSRKYVNPSEEKSWDSIATLKQKRNESLDEYSSRIIEKVSPLALPESSIVSLFVKGIRDAGTKALVKFNKRDFDTVEGIMTKLSEEGLL